MAKKIKGYKIMNSDMTCRNFKFEIGKTYTHKGNISLCNLGFHFCIKPVNCFNYYNFDNKNVVCEIETLTTSKVIHGDDKSVTDKIRILKIIKWSNVLNLVNIGDFNTGYSNSGDSNSGNSNSGDWNSGDSNSGDWNSGYRNSGNRNSGDWNSGYRNSGNSNSGDRNSGYSNSGNSNSGDSNSGDSNSGYSNSGYSNSGDWNSGDRNSGFFNSITPIDIIIFNKSCKKEKWDNAIKPNFIYNININQWISFYNMNNKEKKEKPNAYVCNGYLKTITYKKAWKLAFIKADKNDIKLLKALPNFNKKVFEEITGIKIK